ncbi:hypothetical protein F2Q68_00026222 [Brassica cretica]|uniref:Uncharacterized protein n=1 Tax=Brassica cretica TaxID=69181 RepID=A0A8S9I8L7_BRACR|nr:hypothetical protein F2Q68_00026222 [Brassica cretica]
MWSARFNSFGTNRCTGCKSKIDRVHWDMVPWPVRDDVHGLGRTDHDRDPYDLGRFIGFRLWQSLS